MLYLILAFAKYNWGKCSIIEFKSNSGEGRFKADES